MKHAVALYSFKVLATSYCPHSCIQVLLVLRRHIHGGRAHGSNPPSRPEEVPQNAGTRGQAEAAQQDEASWPSCISCYGRGGCFEGGWGNWGLQRKRRLVFAVIRRRRTERQPEQLHQQSSGRGLADGGGLPLLWYPRQGLQGEQVILMTEPTRFSWVIIVTRCFFPLELAYLILVCLSSFDFTFFLVQFHYYAHEKIMTCNRRM